MSLKQARPNTQLGTTTQECCISSSAYLENLEILVSVRLPPPSAMVGAVE